MFPFLIKKAFFDMWDNLFRIFALNLGYVLIISGTGFLLSAVPQAQLAYFAVLVIGSAALSVFTMGTAAITSELADYKTPEWRVFVDAIRARWLPALLVVVINAAIFLFLLVIALPVYTQSTIGLIALGLLGWAAVFWLLSLQAFFPLITRMADPFGKTIRKCLTLLFDNTGFTAGLFIALNVSAPYLLGLFLLLFLGAPTRLLAFGSPMLLLPGPASAVLLLTVAFKLRMYKYDFLEEHQQASADQASTDQASTDQASTDQASTDQASTDQASTDQPATDQPATDQAATDQPATDQEGVEQAGGRRRRRVRVPWDALLAEDREQVGVRTLRGMIFPWKE